jgi:hypothetical protein
MFHHKPRGKQHILFFRVIIRLIYVRICKLFCAGGEIEKNEMGGACGAYGGGERCAQGSGGEA